MNISIRELQNEQALAVLNAATRGARQILGDRADLIQDVAAETALQWTMRTQSCLPPLEDHAKWAFIVARNRAVMACKKEKRLAEEPVSESLPDTSLTEESAFLDTMSSPTRQITVEEALAAIQKLEQMTLRRIAERNDDTGKRLYVLFVENHWSFEKIADELDIPISTIRRRWYRMMERIADEVYEEAKSDERLAKVFTTIIDEREDFHLGLLGLLNILSKRGFTGIQKLLEPILG